MEQSTGTIGFFGLVWLIIKFGLAFVVAMIILSLIFTLINIIVAKCCDADKSTWASKWEQTKSWFKKSENKQ